MPAVGAAASSGGAPAAASGPADFATFYDTVRVTPRGDIYPATALPTGRAHGALYRVDEQERKVEVGVVDAPCTPDGKCEQYPEKTFNVALDANGRAEYQWQWTDAHPDPGEGLAFKSLYRIRSIAAQVLLPPGA